MNKIIKCKLANVFHQHLFLSYTKYFSIIAMTLWLLEKKQYKEWDILNEKKKNQFTDLSKSSPVASVRANFINAFHTYIWRKSVHQIDI